MGGAGLGGSGFEFGVDPNEDPELALVSSFVCLSEHASFRLIFGKFELWLSYWLSYCP